MNYDSENYFDQEVDFHYEGQDYRWMGDYTIDYFGEEETEFAPAYGEIEVKITHTSSLSSYEDGAEIIPTPSMLMAVELQIESNQ
jgi:RNA recognition motif-containing protein